MNGRLRTAAALLLGTVLLGLDAGLAITMTDRVLLGRAATPFG
jgi:hypothetical protein